MNLRTLSLLAALSAATACLGSEGQLANSASGASAANLRVVNNGGTTVYYLYVSPCSVSTWGVDQLGSNVIRSGGAYTLTNIPAGCYDLRAEASGHVRIAERRGVGVPAGTVVTWAIGGDAGI